MIGDNRRGNPILFLKSFISICFDKSLTCFITNILQEQRGNLQISGRLSSLIDAVIAEQVNLTGYYFIFVITEQENLTGYIFFVNQTLKPDSTLYCIPPYHWYRL